MPISNLFDHKRNFIIIFLTIILKLFLFYLVIKPKYTHTRIVSDDGIREDIIPLT